MASKYAALTTIRLVLTIVFTALVAVATMVLSTYVPQTRGYFNIGETMVYITALLFGPFVGAFAGGVGSMVADILLGYYVYAPATLIIKAAEGFVVGFLNQKAPQSGSKLQWVLFSLIMGGLAGLVLAFVGTSYYSGNIEFSLGFPFLGTATSTVFIPTEFWIGLAALIIALTGMAAYAFEPRLGWMVLSILAGGVLMVIGYFLYQQLFLGYAAIVEVPFNIAQMMVGLIVAIPVVRTIWRSLPSIRDIRGKS
jgi:uncharacterized membrane protein